MKLLCKICKSDTDLYLAGLYDNRHGHPGTFSIYKCQSCGFMQTHPRLKKSSLSKIYTKHYPRQKVDYSAVKNSGKNLPSKKYVWLKGLSTSAHYKTKKGDRVLDVGSGLGYSLVEIKKLGGEPWGLDPDKNAEKVAKKLNLKFHKGFLDNCPFPKNYFDLAAASQVIEHEPDPLSFLKKCQEFTNDGGRIALTLPNTDSLYRKIWGKNWLHWHIPYHLNHFNRKSLKTLVKKSGLKITSLKTVTPNLWTILQIKSYINNPKEGERDLMWDGASNTNPKENLNILDQLITLSLPLFQKLLIINRLIDFLGLGESFVVELKKR